MRKTKSAPKGKITSKFGVWPYDPDECIWHNDPKCVGNVTVDIKARTITFKHISGKAPILYIVLLVMEANKHWRRFVEKDIEDADFSSYSLLTRANDIASTEIFLAHNCENDLPVIEKRLVHVEGIDKEVRECVFNSMEYYLLVGEVDFCLYSWKDRLQELRSDYDFKYIR